MHTTLADDLAQSLDGLPAIDRGAHFIDALGDNRNIAHHFVCCSGELQLVVFSIDIRRNEIGASKRTARRRICTSIDRDATSARHGSVRATSEQSLVQTLDVRLGVRRHARGRSHRCVVCDVVTRLG